LITVHERVRRVLVLCVDDVRKGEIHGGRA
jgi:hypothetical protein